MFSWTYQFLSLCALKTCRVKRINLLIQVYKEWSICPWIYIIVIALQCLQREKKNKPKTFRIGMFLFFSFLSIYLFSQDVALKDQLSHNPGDIFFFCYSFILYCVRKKRMCVKKNNQIWQVIWQFANTN